MKTLILYYSYSGHAKALAEQAAAAAGAAIYEIKDAKRPPKVLTFLMGCPLSIMGKGWSIAPLEIDLEAYDEIQVYAPIWAGNVPPAINSALAFLPAGKAVAYTLVSLSGACKAEERLRTVTEGRGCTFAGLANVKST
ncbi:MAG: hypothetical protein LBR73_04290 [Oscillospiraceae bacterium]|jgi:flavodoxin|nr:hypothetical protein [Oscillospiraceae bacterium]